MFTEIVGYGAMTQRDEAKLLILLDEQYKLARATLEVHAEREIKRSVMLFAWQLRTHLRPCPLRSAFRPISKNAMRTVACPSTWYRHPFWRCGLPRGRCLWRRGGNSAACVQSSAAAGENRISDYVARQVSDMIAYRLRDPGLTSLKNARPMCPFALGSPLTDIAFKYRNHQQLGLCIALRELAGLFSHAKHQHAESIQQWHPFQKARQAHDRQTQAACER